SSALMAHRHLCYTCINTIVLFADGIDAPGPGGSDAAPVGPGKAAQGHRDDEQTSHNQPFEGPTVMIRINPEDRLNPVPPKESQHPQGRCPNPETGFQQKPQTQPPRHGPSRPHPPDPPKPPYCRIRAMTIHNSGSPNGRSSPA